MYPDTQLAPLTLDPLGPIPIAPDEAIDALTNPLALDPLSPVSSALKPADAHAHKSTEGLKP
jgi:hypothetical protein